MHQPSVPALQIATLALGAFFVEVLIRFGVVSQSIRRRVRHKKMIRA
jgi:hypothetical protein